MFLLGKGIPCIDYTHDSDLFSRTCLSKHFIKKHDYDLLEGDK